VIKQIKSRRMVWTGHMARMRKDRKVYKVLVGKPERKRPLVRLTTRRWQDGIRMDLGETGWGVYSGSSWLSTGAGEELL
jgi:hypothetical protein